MVRKRSLQSSANGGKIKVTPFKRGRKKLIATLPLPGNVAVHLYGIHPCGYNVDKTCG
jgi:hypothetical protein